MTVSLAQLVLYGCAASVLAWLSTSALERCAAPLGLLDIPNHRSLHNRITPRGGGLAFVGVSLVLTVAATYVLGIPLSPGIRGLWLGSVVVGAVSLADDLWHISWTVRFSVHVAGALILVASGGTVNEVILPTGVAWELGWMELPLTVLWVVGLTNAYNFMDGIDGLAAGQAVVTAAAMAYLSYLRGGDVTALSLAILAGSVFGFLLRNWSPAAIFMGDIGSAFLGFTFAGWAVLSGEAWSGVLPLAAWVVVLAPFLLDAGITLALRIARGRQWHQPHREHLYQRLVQSGWSHRAVSGLYIGAAAVLAIAAISVFAKW